MEARTHKFAGGVSVCEAIGLQEALSWIKEIQCQKDEVILESDSQLTIHAIRTQLSIHAIWILSSLSMQFQQFELFRGW